MNPDCKKPFTSDFFYKNFSKSFITKKYKEHREELLYEKEYNLLPATQPFVEKQIKIEKIQNRMTEIRSTIKKLKLEYEELCLEMQKINNKKEEEKEEKEEVYLGACPINECRGFLSSSHKCGICRVEVCKKCREVTNKDHVCDKNTIETINELKKTTKSCPNCHTQIFKISGCDQMFCVKCHVAFSWTTGKIEKGIIHNPHYFQYLKDNQGVIPRNPFEDRCGGMPREYILQDPRLLKEVDDGLVHLDSIYFNTADYVTSIYRNVIHLRETVLIRLPTPIDNLSNQDLRVDYLMKKITKKTFKEKLQRKEKEREKKLEYRQIIETYCDVVQDLLTKLSETFELESFINEEIKIRIYAEKALEEMNEKYSSKISSPF